MPQTKLEDSVARLHRVAHTSRADADVPRAVVVSDLRELVRETARLLAVNAELDRTARARHVK